MRSRLAVHSVLALTLLGAVLGLEAPGPATAAIARPPLGSGGALLYLGGALAGNVRAAAGGTAVGVVASDARAGAGLPNKHITGVEYEPLELDVDLSLEPAFYDWVNAAWKATPQPRSGSLVLLDSNRNASQVREFNNALITESTLSACDATARTSGGLSVALSAERVTNGAPGGKAGAPSSVRTRPWVVSNFRLEIDGLDTSRVVRVSPVHVKATLAPSGGDLRDRAPQVARTEIDNLKIQLNLASADAWRKWHEEFVVQGNASDKFERSGRLLLLGANMRDVLAEVRFYNLGIIALRASEQSDLNLEAELYVERAELSLGGKS